MTRNISLKNVRNIGIMAHIDAGKTTTTERIIYYTGLTHKIGEVHDGAAVMDWMTQEQERGITITSAATTCHWHGHKINLIDTPGHVDFTVEVERSLRILDGAIFLLDAKEGVEAQTEAVWHQADYHKVPRILLINKMDVTGASFDNSIESIKSRLNGNPVAIQIPMGNEKDFEGIISLVDMKAYYNSGENGEIVTIKDIPSEHLEIAIQYRTELIESIADYDDELMMVYLNGLEIKETLIIDTIRRATLLNKIVPVLCGAAYKNKGIQNLLDAIINYLPSPEDKPVIKGHTKEGSDDERNANDQAPFSALIFKIMTDPYVGRLSYFRVYSGSIKVGGSVMNVSKMKKERINKLLQMHANSRNEIDEAVTGDIVAAVGLKFSSTGDTLSDMNKTILLESIEFPDPVISRAIEPKTPAEFDKLNDALLRLTEEDPTLKSYIHPDTGQMLISGMGELHLEVILDRLHKEFNITVNSGKPQVTYKESIQNPVTVDCTFQKQLGTNAVYAYIKMTVEPKKRGTGHRLDITASNKNKYPEFIKACEQGIVQSLKSGVIGGYEVIDLHVDVTEINVEEDKSTDVAFITAASYAVTDALKKGKSKLLEPIFSISVISPEKYIGDVIDDLNKRHGIITNIENNNTRSLVKATIPLSKLFGYTTDLRSVTRGYGHHTMIFSHYDFVD